jgi:hypothetical protein
MAIAEIGRIGQWGTSAPSSTPTPLSGRNSYVWAPDGGMLFTAEFCMPASFSPTTPVTLRLHLDKPGEQGGQKIAEVSFSQVSSDAERRCFRATHQLSAAQIAQHNAPPADTSRYGGRLIYSRVYINGVLSTYAPLASSFVMKTSTPAPSVSSWPNPAPTTVSTTVKRDVQVVAPIVTTQPTLAPSVQAAAAALLTTPSAVKTSAPTPAMSTTKVQESGSLMPTTLLPKGAVQLPVKGGFGVGAYAAMGLAILAGFWWWRKAY